MTCEKCAAENPDGAAFCMACGSPLTADCPNCGTALPGGARFCFSCGTEIEQAAAATEDTEAATDTDGLARYIPSQLLSKLQFAAASGGMQGERRKVTMLFCDVEGSTAAAEQLDPEEWADIMNGAFEHLIAPVYRYEGTLARLMGDAILAFFGAPIGHEDDPERALLAALEILQEIEPYRATVRKEWGIDLAVRIGINTGLVVVGAVGSDLRVEYTAMGDAVNLAARMEQTAAPGTIQVTADTKVLVERLFEFEPLGETEVKGKQEPVATFRVVRALERPENLRGIEGLSAPLIGRDEELQQLLDAVHEVVGSGRGQVVSVMGEAGLGKSRLLAELERRLDEEGDAPAFHVGRSLSYETGTPYTPARRVLQSLLGLTGDESDAEAWRRIETEVMRAAPGRVGEIAPFLAWMLEVPIAEPHQQRTAYLQPPELRDAAFRAALEYIEAVSAHQSTILVFEDLHWADEGSVELVEAMLGIVERSRLAIVLLFRPRRDEIAWRVHQLAEQQYAHLYVTVDLHPLGENETRELVASLLAVDGLTDDLRGRILDRAEGNPFFVEEIIRTMIDAGAVAHDGTKWVATDQAGTFDVPENLRAVLTTRLDRLDDAARGIVQAASVVGRRFRYDELAAAMTDVTSLDQGLIELQRRELISEVTRIPKRLYSFRHALLQEAAYSTVLLKQRTQLHSSVAEFLIAISPDRVSDIADHLVAGRQAERATPYLVAAGETAAQTYALDAAAARFDQALDLVDDETDPSLLARALEGRGKIHEYRFELTEAAATYQRLIEDGKRLDDARLQVSGINKLALIRGFFFDEREDALEQLGESEAMARQLDLGEGLVEACISQCYLRTAYAEFDEVEHYMNEVTTLGEELQAEEPTLFGMTHLANTLLFLTRFDEALDQSLKALAAAEELGNLHYQAELLTFPIPLCHMRNGDVEAANAAVERGMELSQRIGDRVSESMAGVFQGKAAMDRGHVDDAVALFRRATAAAEATGQPSYRAMSMCAAGTCQVQIGGPYVDAALELHGETLEVMELPTGKGLGAWLWSEIGYCAMAADDDDLASDLFERALTEQTMMMHLARPNALLGKAELALRGGRLDDARSLYTEAAEYVEERAMWDKEADVAFVAGIIEAAAENHAAALEEFDRCEMLLISAGMQRRMIALLAARARSLDALGRHEDAASARELGEGIAAGIEHAIEDGELQAGFRQGAAATLGLTPA